MYPIEGLSGTAIHAVHMHAEVSGYNVSYLPLATKMGKLKNIARSSKLSSHYRQ